MSEADKPASTRYQYRYPLGQNLTPASRSEMERLKVLEVARKKWDKSYIDAATAGSIPQEVVDGNPELAWRIQTSQPDWPEGRASATEALGVLPGGEGEEIEHRAVDAEALFTGGPHGRTEE